jgi:hypothetical protein
MIFIALTISIIGIGIMTFKILIISRMTIRRRALGIMMLYLALAE